VITNSILVHSHSSVLLGPVVFTPQHVTLSTKSTALLLALSGGEILARVEVRGEGGSSKLLFLRGYF
jgi:hypothetical protein